MTTEELYDILETVDQVAYSVSKWEGEFIEDILSRQPPTFSTKQAQVILRLAQKYLKMETS